MSSYFMFGSIHFTIFISCVYVFCVQLYGMVFGDVSNNMHTVYGCVLFFSIFVCLDMSCQGIVQKIEHFCRALNFFFSYYTPLDYNNVQRILLVSTWFFFSSSSFYFLLAWANDVNFFGCCFSVAALLLLIFWNKYTVFVVVVIIIMYLFTQFTFSFYLIHSLFVSFSHVCF